MLSYDFGGKIEWAVSAGIITMRIQDRLQPEVVNLVIDIKNLYDNNISVLYIDIDNLEYATSNTFQHRTTLM